MADIAPGRAPRWLGAALLLAALALVGLAVAGLALHPAFQPNYAVRACAPAIALVAAAAFTHQAARRRALVDVPGEFDPRGRALYLGLVMTAMAIVIWLDAAQAVPALLNGAVGAPRRERGVVTERVPLAGDPDCPHRLQVASASIDRPFDACVTEAVWAGAVASGPIAVDLRASRIGAEIVGVGR
jgi:hypothetical protein